MKEKLFRACLSVIETQGWRAFSFAKAAQESGLPLQDFHAAFKTPSDVLIYLFQKVDKTVLKACELDDHQTTKDKLFEVFMARLDALQPYKKVIGAFWRDCFVIPEELPRIGCQGYESMRWVLEAANLESRGLIGFMRVQGLSMAYLYVLHTWLQDESVDLSKTMVTLDQSLTNLEKIAKLLPKVL